MAAIYSTVKFKKHWAKNSGGGEPSMGKSNTPTETVYSEVRLPQSDQGNQKRSANEAAAKTDIIYSNLGFPNQVNSDGSGTSNLSRPNNPAGPSPQAGPTSMTTGNPKWILLLLSLCVFLFAVALTIGVLYNKSVHQLTERKRNIQQLEEEKRSLSSELTKKEKSIQLLKTEKKTLEGHVNDTENRIKQLESDKDNVTKEMKGQESRISDLMTEKANLEQQLEGQESRISDLMTEKANLEQQLKDLKKNPPCLCAEGWEYFNEKCYYFSTDEMTWNKSRDACVSEGGHLVIISSKEEQDFLKSLSYAKENKYWIGLTDAKEEGDWHWLDGTVLSKEPRYWLGNEPDDWTGENNMYPEGEDCAVMELSHTAYHLWDGFCNVQKYEYKRVCEAKAAVHKT